MNHTNKAVFSPTIGTIHFIGIGGIGMSGIAEILHYMGFKVQGSDISENYITQRLEKLGIKIYKSHDKKNVSECSLVVKSTAIKNNNCEILKAIKLSIPIIKRSEMLAEIMRFKHPIVISGTHGKTTTTSLVAHLLEEAKLDPTVINGGIINSKKTNAYIGKGPYLVAEADESDGTFIKIPSYASIITNINPEHLDYYKNFNNVIKAYKTFITNLPFYGFAVLCYDHPVVKKLADSVKNRRVISYGIDSDDLDVKAINIQTLPFGSKFDILLSESYTKNKHIENRYINGVELNLNGKHNILNCLAAICIGLELNLDINTISNSFATFKGVKRRFTKTGEVNGITYIDDYAHHPNEIQATINAAKDITKLNNGNVIAIVQPHRYSRLKDLMNDFIKSILQADKIIIVELYPAGEKPIEGINSAKLVKLLKLNDRQKQIFYLKNLSNLPKLINKLAKSPDIVLLMGAGNITKWSNELPDIMQKF